MGASWFPVDIWFPTIYVGKRCHESSICLEGNGTHSGTGIKKKKTATKNRLGLNRQISVCETGTLTGI